MDAARLYTILQLDRSIGTITHLVRNHHSLKNNSEELARDMHDTRSPLMGPGLALLFFRSVDRLLWPCSLIWNLAETDWKTLLRLNCCERKNYSDWKKAEQTKYGISRIEPILDWTSHCLLGEKRERKTVNGSAAVWTMGAGRATHIQ